MAIWACVAAVLCCNLKLPLTASSVRVLLHFQNLQSMNEAFVLSGLIRLTISRASCSRRVESDIYNPGTISEWLALYHVFLSVSCVPGLFETISHSLFSLSRSTPVFLATHTISTIDAPRHPSFHQLENLVASLVHSWRHPSNSVVSGTMLSFLPSGTRVMTQPTPGREY